MPIGIGNTMKPKKKKEPVKSKSATNSSSSPSPSLAEPSTSAQQDLPQQPSHLVHAAAGLITTTPPNTMLAVESRKAPQFPQPSKYQRSLSDTDNGHQTPMRFERNRFKTFEHWTCPFVTPKDLAAAGFYSIHVEDVVRCAFCSVEIGSWEEGDDPMSDHQRWRNECPFLRGKNVGNVPYDSPENFSAGNDSDSDSDTRSEDTCGKFGIEVRPNSYPERDPVPNATVVGLPTDPRKLRKLGVTPSMSARSPAFATEAARLKSYQDWPKSIKQKPEELSAAGFYYTGTGDQTVCFHCGGGLKDWEESDDPWEQHARWFSKCWFLNVVKGPEFVKEVCSKKDEATTNGASGTQKENIERVKTDADVATVATALSAPAVQTESSSSSAKASNEVNMCKICYQEEMGVLFLPCGHLVACVKCAPSLTSCAVCRKPLEATVRVFLS